LAELREEEMNVELKVDGKAVDLNAFTQEIIGNVAVAMAESLRGVGQDWKGIEIRIEK
jgi:hypothetical protein